MRHQKESIDSVAQSEDKTVKMTVEPFLRLSVNFKCDGYLTGAHIALTYGRNFSWEEGANTMMII